MTPRVSVVIPTRNRPEHVARLATCLRDQSLAAWEALIVDDGSEPGALAAVQALADDRIRVLQRDGPPGADRCRNQGFAASRADLVVFFDDDDLLSPDCLRARVAAFEGQPALDLITFPYERFRVVPGDSPGDRGPVPSAAPLDSYLRLEPPWHTGGAIWRRSFLDRLGGWDERLASWQDWEFGVRALSLAPRLAFQDGPRFYVRVPSERHRTISSGGWVPENVRSWSVALHCASTRLAAANLLDPRRRALLSWLHVFVAERLVAVGDPQAAAWTWSQCRALGLPSWAEEALAFVLLRAARVEALRPRAEVLILLAMASRRFGAVMAALRRQRPTSSS